MSGQAKRTSQLARPKVLLADDHDMVLERVVYLLEDFEVVGSVHNGEDLVTEALRLKPDVIVSDITMPILNGIEAAHELHDAGSTAKFVFLTVHERPEFLQA